MQLLPLSTWQGGGSIFYWKVRKHHFHKIYDRYDFYEKRLHQKYKKKNKTIPPAKRSNRNRLSKTCLTLPRLIKNHFSITHSHKASLIITDKIISTNCMQRFFLSARASLVLATSLQNPKKSRLQSKFWQEAFGHFAHRRTLPFIPLLAVGFQLRLKRKSMKHEIQKSKTYSYRPQLNCYESTEEEMKRPLASVHPIPTDVRLYLDSRGIGASNVPFYSRQRECTGLHITTWGYFGNGPHCLAADILQWFGMSKNEADHWSIELVIEFLNFIPKEGAVIPRERIQKVVSEIRNGTRKHLRDTDEKFIDRANLNRDAFLAKGGF